MGEEKTCEHAKKRGHRGLCWPCLAAEMRSIAIEQMTKVNDLEATIKAARLFLKAKRPTAYAIKCAKAALDIPYIPQLKS